MWYHVMKEYSHQLFLFPVSDCTVSKILPAGFGAWMLGAGAHNAGKRKSHSDKCRCSSNQRNHTASRPGYRRFTRGGGQVLKADLMKFASSVFCAIYMCLVCLFPNSAFYVLVGVCYRLCAYRISMRRMQQKAVCMQFICISVHIHSHV